MKKSGMQNFSWIQPFLGNSKLQVPLARGVFIPRQR
jgi:hypothetical protein